MQVLPPTTRRATRGTMALLATLAILPAAAAQAAAPTASTGGATKVSPQSATLNGTVNPKSKDTIYFFQYGPTVAYGSQTPDIGAGAGAVNVGAASDVIGLASATKYHYRLVARNADGTTSGSDRSFKTANQPLGFSLEASPNPALFGGAVTLQGVLSGTGNAGRQVALQQRVFPYTADFATVGNPQVTGSSGAFSFPLLGVTTNAQFRTITTAGTNVTSAVVTLGVAVKVTTKVSAHRVRRGRLVRFSGTITPAKVGALFSIQKLNREGAWVTIAGGVARGGGTTFTRYTKRIRARRSGSYRVFVGIADGVQVSNVGVVKLITVR